MASTSELLENQWDDLVFFKSFPHISAGPQKLTALEIKYEKFGPNKFFKKGNRILRYECRTFDAFWGFHIFPFGPPHETMKIKVV